MRLYTKQFAEVPANLVSTLRQDHLTLDIESDYDLFIGSTRDEKFIFLVATYEDGIVYYGQNREKRSTMYYGVNKDPNSDFHLECLESIKGIIRN